MQLIPRGCVRTKPLSVTLAFKLRVGKAQNRAVLLHCTLQIVVKTCCTLGGYLNGNLDFHAWLGRELKHTRIKFFNDTPKSPTIPQNALASDTLRPTLNGQGILKQLERCDD